MEDTLKYFESLGLSEFIRDKDGKLIYLDSNLYMARQIVEGYFEGEVIDDDARRAILQCILKPKNLKRDSESSKAYLSDVIEKFQAIGFGVRETYGIIINWAVNKSILKCTYNSFFNRTRIDLKNFVNSYDFDIKAGRVPFTYVSLSTIRSAKIEYLSKRQIEELNKYFEELGLTSMIKSENGEERYPVSNLYIIYQIVEWYCGKNKKRDVDLVEEKKKVAQELLEHAELKYDKSGKTYSLVRLMQAMSKVGLSEDAICGIIINLAFDMIKIEGKTYSYWLRNCSAEYEVLLNCLSRIQAAGELFTEVIIPTRLYKYYKNLGLIDFIRDENGNLIYSDSNLYIAHQIVEGYFEGQNIDDKIKKVILQSILDERFVRLTVGTLEVFVQNMVKLGFSKSEIYGIIINLSINGNIINLSINGNIIGENGCTYGYFLREPQNVFKNLVKYRGQIESEVTCFTIERAKCKYMSQAEIDELLEYFEELGLIDFIRDENGNLIYPNVNLYMARYIVEKQFSGKRVDDNLKITILKALLGNSILKISEYGVRGNLVVLMERMKKFNFSEEEIYAIMINLGLNVIKIKGYGYRNLLYSPNLEYELFFKKLQDMKKAGILPIEIVLPECLHKYFDDLGLSRYIRDEYGNVRFSDSNLYMARQIVEGYFESDEIGSVARKAILQCVLGNMERIGNNLFAFEQELVKMGLDRKEIYGCIINLGVNRKSIKGGPECRNRIETRVTEQTIRTAIKRKIKATDIAAEGLLFCVTSGEISLCDETAAEVRKLQNIDLSKNVDKKNEI